MSFISPSETAQLIFDCKLNTVPTWNTFDQLTHVVSLPFLLFAFLHLIMFNPRIDLMSLSTSRLQLFFGRGWIF